MGNVFSLYGLAYLFVFFIVYSFVGWIIEIIVVSIDSHKLVDRGFLIGPVLPIYGCGVVFISILLEKYKSSPLALFVLAMAICMVLEYLTSYIMEKLFKARWWDYSDSKFNINGRICLETTVPFGIGGLIIVYGTNPYVYKLLNSLSNKTIYIAAIILAVIFITDIIISFVVVNKIKKVDIEPNKDNTEVITKKIKEYLKNYSVLTRRLMNAFPNLKSTIEITKEKVTVKARETKEAISDTVEKTKNNLKNITKKNN